jgi:hypothetical protein
MRRILGALGAVALLMVQSASALAALSPSPPLDGLLVAPPGTGFVEDKGTAGFFEGPFDAAKYAEITASDPAQAKQALEQDGFLAGYGRTWVASKAGHIYIEAVMAFSGSKGAKAWLKGSEAADKKVPSYQKALTISGIDSYYGARLVDTAQKIYADAFVFVKGNDAFLVSYVSAKDDLAAVAATQARRQFDAAPAYTIPPGEWPEANAANSASGAIKIVGAFVAGIVIIGLIVAGILIVRSRRRPLMLAAAGPIGAAAGGPASHSGLQLSEDKRSWWDGTTWRDADREVPPTAQRSDDGKFWWDGQAWRPTGPT